MYYQDRKVYAVSCMVSIAKTLEKSIKIRLFGAIRGAINGKADNRNRAVFIFNASFYIFGNLF